MKRFIYLVYICLFAAPIGLTCAFLAWVFDRIDDLEIPYHIRNFFESCCDYVLVIKRKAHDWAYKTDKV